MAKGKQARGDKQDSVAAKKAWLDRLAQSKGMSAVDATFLISQEELRLIVGNKWYQVLMWIEDHPEKKVKNILAIMAKSTRKSVVFAAFVIYLLGKYPWLHAMAARDTKTRSSDELMQLLQETRSILYNEYSIAWSTPDRLTESAVEMYLIRDKRRKDNQKIKLTSFEELVKRGGFVKPTTFFWEELVNPDSVGSAPEVQDFLDGLDFINSKNEENFMAYDQDIYSFPTNLFAMNKWDTGHPLNIFAEIHFPWQPVKKWMLLDLEKNNFMVHYVETAAPGWEQLNNTLIVYGSKFSNHLNTKHPKWVQKQKDLVATGNQRHLGIILGDIFEGNEKLNRTYTFKDMIEHDKLPKQPQIASYGIDRDVNEEIVITPKYLIEMDDIQTLEKYKRSVFAVVKGRQRVLHLKGLKMDDSSKAQLIEDWMKSEMLELQRSNPSKEQQTVVFLDDDQAIIIGRYNADEELTKTGLQFTKAVKHGDWGIYQRQEYMDNAHESGFESTLPGNERLETDYKICKNAEDSKKRDEKKGRNSLNAINSDEYASYIFNGYRHQFPEGYWEWYFTKDLV